MGSRSLLHVRDGAGDTVAALYCHWGSPYTILPVLAHVALSGSDDLVAGVLEHGRRFGTEFEFAAASRVTRAVWDAGDVEFLYDVAPWMTGEIPVRRELSVSVYGRSGQRLTRLLHTTQNALELVDETVRELDAAARRLREAAQGGFVRFAEAADSIEREIVVLQSAGAKLAAPVTL